MKQRGGPKSDQGQHVDEQGAGKNTWHDEGYDDPPEDTAPARCELAGFFEPVVESRQGDGGGDCDEGKIRQRKHEDDAAGPEMAER